MSAPVPPLAPAPYRFDTERLTVRCFEPTDAPAMHTAVRESRAHLAPWMWWTEDNAASVDNVLAVLRRFRGNFAHDRDWAYGIFELATGALVGGLGIHPRSGPVSRELGYWLHQDHVGRGFVTEAAGAATRVAFDIVGVDRVDILVDPANAPSAAVPARLGFTHEATLRRRLVSRSLDGETILCDAMVWSLATTDYPTSPAAQIAYRALDVLGRPVDALLARPPMPGPTRP